MAFGELDPVVLAIDLPDGRLKKGLLGTVVDVINPKRVLVEFVAANGRTIALLPVDARSLRKPTDRDAIAVARVEKAKGKVIGPFSSTKATRAVVKHRRRSTTPQRRRRSA
jgi:hypothetical protein